MGKLKEKEELCTKKYQGKYMLDSYHAVIILVTWFAVGNNIGLSDAMVALGRHKIMQASKLYHITIVTNSIVNTINTFILY